MSSKYCLLQIQELFCFWGGGEMFAEKDLETFWMPLRRSSEGVAENLHPIKGISSVMSGGCAFF